MEKDIEKDVEKTVLWMYGHLVIMSYSIANFIKPTFYDPAFLILLLTFSFYKCQAELKKLVIQMLKH